VRSPTVIDLLPCRIRLTSARRPRSTRARDLAADHGRRAYAGVGHRFSACPANARSSSRCFCWFVSDLRQCGRCKRRTVRLAGIGRFGAGTGRPSRACRPNVHATTFMEKRIEHRHHHAPAEHRRQHGHRGGTPRHGGASSSPTQAIRRRHAVVCDIVEAGGKAVAARARCERCRLVRRLSRRGGGRAQDHLGPRPLRRGWSTTRATASSIRSRRSPRPSSTALMGVHLKGPFFLQPDAAAADGRRRRIVNMASRDQPHGDRVAWRPMRPSRAVWKC